MPLRVSKTNTRKTSRENIVLAITKTELFPILKWIGNSIGKRKEGFVFPDITTKKVYNSLKSASKKLNWPHHPTPHGGRLGYIINSSKSGVEDEHIVNTCRWKGTQMLRYYRLYLLASL
jgi:hypothetical protein